MADSKSKKIWHYSRRIFRWLRILFFFAIFLAVFAAVYLHEIGLPGFIKEPLLAKLRDGGVDVQFSKMRWQWPASVIIEKATFASTNKNAAATFSTAKAELKFDLPSTDPKQWKLNFLSLANGTFAGPQPTNGTALSLTNINLVLRLRPHDILQLDKFDASFSGASIHLNASITNASAMRDWKFSEKKAGGKAGPDKLEQFAKIWEQIQFDVPPDLDLEASIDARDMDTLRCNFALHGSKMTTPWGELNRFKLNAKIIPAEQKGKQARVQFFTAHVHSRWLSGDQVNLNLRFPILHTNQLDSEIDFASKSFSVVTSSTNNVATNQFQAAEIKWNGKILQSFTNSIPLAVSGKLQLTKPSLTLNATNHYSAQNAALIVSDFSSTNHAITRVEDGAFWSKLAPYAATIETTVEQLATPHIQLETLHYAGQWKAPEFVVEKLEARLYGGHLEASGKLNVATRAVQGHLVSDIDAKKILPLISTNRPTWLEAIAWEKAPQLSGEFQATLPSWTSHTTNWTSEILSTLFLQGNISTEKWSYQNVPVLSFHSDFSYSNMVWKVPNLRLVSPDGTFGLNAEWNQHNQQHRYIIDSTIDPKAIRPLLSAEQQDVFDTIKIGGPPIIHAEIQERGFDFENCDVRANVVATNLAFRDLKLDRLKTTVHYTNRIITLLDTKAEYKTQLITCPEAEVNLREERVTMREVYSTMEPMPVTRAIGKKVAAAIEPYHFAKTPTVYVDGSFVFDHPETADMHFIVEGEQFDWGLLKADRGIAKVDWIGNNLSITNITASAYRGGEIKGWVMINFAAAHGNDFQFGVVFTNLDLQTGLASLGKTNRLEGLLQGKLELTYANTRDLGHWKGFGWMQVQDGFFWETPIFGILSPVLNAIAPGAGSSRAREASATFVITNSLIFSDDLEIHSPTMRIKYRGTVDFQKQVDARVEAQLLRDAGSLGHVLSVALTPLSKIFEYKISGDLENPKEEPVFIPSLVMNLFRPFHTLKKILPEKSSADSSKNSGPVEEPVKTPAR